MTNNVLLHAGWVLVHSKVLIAFGAKVYVATIGQGYPPLFALTWTLCKYVHTSSPESYSDADVDDKRQKYDVEYEPNYEVWQDLLLECIIFEYHI